MACVDDKGQLTASARKLLETIENNALTPEEIAKEAALPLFKVRSSMRDMKSMGFVTEEENGAYQMNPEASKLLKK
ncbi:replication/maintenance protein RepL [Aliibacillus thermotolerans]|uniref:Replication/maintenance protein RepL n=1 Tax=Aliibacillus thermotolerans TaxID=1834418 RepID=A0ABW0U5X1_9BACI|nr:replication/maintenance protein RepL [Aliibacillus thermotolerans]MDA3129289.1 hypothetical protein [Aliibacillus thermotolerans]